MRTNPFSCLTAFSTEPLDCGSYAGGDSSLDAQLLRHGTAQVDQRGLVVRFQEDTVTVSEPADALNGLVDCVLVQAPLAQDWMGQDCPGIPVLDDEDRQGSVAPVLRQEAVVHGDSRD